VEKSTFIKALSSVALSVSMAFEASAAYAHGAAAHAKPSASAPISTEEHAFGKQGNPKKVDRTITVDMTDSMRFHPSEITVKQGETVKFVVVNKGKIMHEMVLGTMEELKEHGEMMRKHPGMEHDEPYMTHVAPGKKENLVWQFTQPDEFYYGCLIPGHFEAGMIGRIIVTKG
jgi:uncharacterized cupredoxin-like copper-binding protein